MQDPILFIVGIIVLIAILGLLWLAFSESVTIFPNPISQKVARIVGLIALALILWWLFGGYIPRFSGMIGGTPIYAASSAKKQENGTCEPFATVGNFEISHCLDPNGNEFEASESGMLLSPK